MSDNAITLTDVVALLLADNIKEQKLVVLFDDNRTRNSFAEKVNTELKANPKFIVDNSVPFKTNNNEIRLGDKKIFLGLKMQKELLVQHYSDEQLKEYKQDAIDKGNAIPVRR